MQRFTITTAEIANALFFLSLSLLATAESADFYSTALLPSTLYRPDAFASPPVGIDLESDEPLLRLAELIRIREHHVTQLERECTRTNSCPSVLRFVPAITYSGTSLADDINRVPLKHANLDRDTLIKRKEVADQRYSILTGGGNFLPKVPSRRRHGRIMVNTGKDIEWYKKQKEVEEQKVVKEQKVIKKRKGIKKQKGVKKQKGIKKRKGIKSERPRRASARGRSQGKEQQ